MGIFSYFYILMFIIINICQQQQIHASAGLPHGVGGAGALLGAGGLLFPGGPPPTPHLPPPAHKVLRFSLMSFCDCHFFVLNTKRPFINYIRAPRGKGRFSKCLYAHILHTTTQNFIIIIQIVMED